MSKGLALGSGQTVRQTFGLELGTVAETVTVAGEAPVIDTASSQQVNSLGSQEVRELPISRRNITNLLALAPGVTTSGSGSVQMNGVAAGGTGVTVDGTEANSNPEARSLSQYGGQNQIDVMSIEAVSEVQIVKGVLPAEYGGVTGGQVNMISRSGTNVYHGSIFQNTQKDTMFARDPFLPNTVAKPKSSFYQRWIYRPILKNKVSFFTIYEGYHENAGQPHRCRAIPHHGRLLAARRSPKPRSCSTRSLGDRASRRLKRHRGPQCAAIAGRASGSQGKSHRGQRRRRPVQRREPGSDLHPLEAVHTSAGRIPEQLERPHVSEHPGSRRHPVGDDQGTLGFGESLRLQPHVPGTVRRVSERDRSEEQQRILNYGRRAWLINISGLFSTPSSRSTIHRRASATTRNSAGPSIDTCKNRVSRIRRPGTA